MCRILKTSAQVGVSELQFAGLHIVFGGSPSDGLAVVPQPLSPYSVPAMTDEAHFQQTKEALIRDEVETREEQLATLLITDPFKYEQLLSQGELTDAVDQSDSDEPDAE